MKKLALLTGCAVLVAALAAGLYFYRHRYIRSEQDLLQILPDGDVTTFYANIETLRKSGTLKYLTGARAVHEGEYERFVQQVHFDYTRDLDRLAAATDGRQLFVLLQGRFDWSRLRLFPRAHGGSCSNQLCSVPASTPGRWASYYLIQPDVLALALSSDPRAANELQPPAHPRLVRLAAQPVWVQLADSLLKNPVDLPAPLRIFAISLQSASPVLIAAAPAAEGSGAAFVLQLDAACPSVTAADTLRKQLVIQTRMLQLEIKREGQQPNSADLTGLLTAGSFRQTKKHLLASWPIRYELLQSLQ